MRVLVGAESFLPAVNGVTNTVLRALHHLDSRGHDVAVIAPGPGPSSLVLDSGTEIAVERVTSLQSARYPGLPVGFASKRRLDKAIRDFAPDVVHLAAPAILGRAIGLRSAAHSIPTVALFQTDVAGFARDYGVAFADRAIWGWLRAVHANADLTLAPTPTIAADLRMRGFRRVGVWGRGVDHRQFSRTRRSDAFRAANGAGTAGKLLVGYVGRLAREKQIDRLAQIADLPNVKLVLVGDGPDRARLQRLLPGASFPGFLSGDELGTAVASLDVFVHTGPNETYCQALQEAMAASVAAVAPDSGGPVDLIDHERTGLLYDHHSRTALRTALQRLIADDAMRQALGTAAHAAVRNRTWESLGDELVDHYRAAVDFGRAYFPPIPLRAVRSPRRSWPSAA